MAHHIEHKGTSSQKSQSDLGINTKSNDADFATAVDIANEKLIMEGIAAQFPTHEVIGEEAVGTVGARAGAKTAADIDERRGGE